MAFRKRNQCFCHWKVKPPKIINILTDDTFFLFQLKSAFIYSYLYHWHSFMLIHFLFFSSNNNKELKNKQKNKQIRTKNMQTHDTTVTSNTTGNNESMILFFVCEWGSCYCFFTIWWKETRKIPFLNRLSSFGQSRRTDNYLWIWFKVTQPTGNYRISITRKWIKVY